MALMWSRISWTLGVKQKNKNKGSQPMTKEEYQFIEAVISEMKKGYFIIDDALTALRALSGTLVILSEPRGFTLTAKDLDDVLKSFRNGMEHQNEKE